MRKTIILIGEGTVGAAIKAELEKDYRVVTAGRTKGRYDLEFDAANSESIDSALKLFKGPIHHIIAAAGKVVFVPVHEMTQDKFNIGLQGKLAVAYNVATIGGKYIQPGGCIVVTSGIVSAQNPVDTGLSAAVVNAAIHEMVERLGQENLPYRLLDVSPTALQGSWESYKSYFPGYAPVFDAVVGRVYRSAIEGNQTGKVIEVGYATARYSPKL